MASDCAIIPCTQEFISEIADLNPEYAVSGIVLDLLQSDSTEAQIIAMRALYLIATSVPAGKATAVERSSGQLRRTSQKGATAAGRRMVQVCSSLACHTTGVSHASSSQHGCHVGWLVAMFVGYLLGLVVGCLVGGCQFSMQPNLSDSTHNIVACYVGVPPAGIGPHPHWPAPL